MLLIISYLCGFQVNEFFNEYLNEYEYSLTNE